MSKIPTPYAQSQLNQNSNKNIPNENNINNEAIESNENLDSNSIINIDMDLSSGFDIEQINQFNTKSVDLISILY